LPSSHDAAISKIKWLTRHLHNNNSPDTQRAVQLLTAATHPRTVTDPKQIVVGITATSLPGLTIGRIAKKIEYMMVVIRRDVAISQPPNLIKQVTRASLNVLANAFDSAQGQTKNLEPAIGQWFLDSRQLSFYSAHSFTLIRIESELTNLNIPHAVIAQDGATTAIAISPTVNTTYSQLRWELDPTEF